MSAMICSRICERLPISYFDTHAHGDIMSVYTNDADTLRQVITQSIPQTLSAGFTVIFVGVSMIVMSWPLAILSFAMVAVMLTVAGKIRRTFRPELPEAAEEPGKGKRIYRRDDGSGQKVIKVFGARSRKSSTDSTRSMRSCCESSYKANTFASVLMPVVANIGNVCLCACPSLAGGVLAISGISGLTLGGLASFLQLNRSFNMPIIQYLPADECRGDGHGRRRAYLCADG